MDSGGTVDSWGRRRESSERWGKKPGITISALPLASCVVFRSKFTPLILSFYMFQSGKTVESVLPGIGESGKTVVKTR